MKPEYKAEYEALNLPLEFHNDECGSANGWFYWGLLNQHGPADVLIRVSNVSPQERKNEESHKRAVAEFIVKAASNHHALKSAVEELRDAVGELVEVATMRGDNCLPNPCNDPKLWSGRMQEAWNFVERALKQTEGLV
jgi:hypothetical protein